MGGRSRVGTEGVVKGVCCVLCSGEQGEKNTLHWSIRRIQIKAKEFCTRKGLGLSDAGGAPELCTTIDRPKTDSAAPSLHSTSVLIPECLSAYIALLHTTIGNQISYIPR